MGKTNRYREEYIGRINRALDFITSALNEDLPLETVAGAAFFSSFHFHRIFTAMIGETPADYVRRLRLEKAAQFLVYNRELNVTEIATRCGFNSSTVFSRAFRDRFGCAPQDWRKQFSKKSGSISKKGKDTAPPPPYHTGTMKEGGKAKIEIRNLPAYRVAYVRCMSGYHHASIGRAWSQIWKWASNRDLIGENTAGIGVPLDDPDITPAAKCRYYAGVTVPADFSIPAGTHSTVSVMDIPAGKYAVYHFEGREKDIAPAYTELYGEWLPDSGFVPEDRPALEMHTGSFVQSASKKFRYDICLPIKPL